MIICPYCKRIIKCNGECGNYCALHYPIDVSFYIIDNQINTIELRQNACAIIPNDYFRYSIIIFLNNNYMILKDYSSRWNIPYDKNLTPENFEQKIKTYLSFL
jgi:hypothetical protein